MAVKPHKSTVDTMIDQFDRFDVDTQGRVLDQIQLVHRLAKRRKPEKPAEPVDTVSISPEARAKLNGKCPPFTDAQLTDDADIRKGQPVAGLLDQVGDLER